MNLLLSKEVVLMPEKKRSVKITLPPDLKQRLEVLKEQQFMDKPLSEMYRTIVSIGLQAAHAREQQETPTPAV